MFIYDSTTIAFIQKTETIVREIVHSLGIEVRRSRFLFNNLLYPIQVVVFEGKEWGYFDASYLQIALNKRLIFEAKDSVVRDIIKHELAHYFTWILHKDVSPHGSEFRKVCTDFGFPQEVSRATMDIETANSSKEGDVASERVLEKVKKLLSLAQSSNVHEAELATMRANELLLRHNLDYQAQQEEPIYLERLLHRKRKDSKLSCIYSILKHFIVRTVISHGQESCSLEVSGTLTNVKLAGYVASFLDLELDFLWKQAQRTHGIKGIRSKNSFFLGVAEGFDHKMIEVKTRYSEQDKKALALVEKKLHVDSHLIYRRLGRAYSGHQSDKTAKAIGHSAGLRLSIKNAVEGKGKNLYLPSGKT